MVPVEIVCFRARLCEDSRRAVSIGSLRGFQTGFRALMAKNGPTGATSITLSTISNFWTAFSHSPGQKQTFAGRICRRHHALLTPTMPITLRCRTLRLCTLRVYALRPCVTSAAHRYGGTTLCRSGGFQQPKTGQTVTKLSPLASSRWALPWRIACFRMSLSAGVSKPELVSSEMVNSACLQHRSLLEGRGVQLLYHLYED